MAIFYGLIIPRSYNDYFSRSDPAAIQQQMRLLCDSQLDDTSTDPIQNKPVAEAIEDINDKIPAQASDTNQLADKEFVNSSVGTNTANYISNNGEPFTSVAALEAYAGTVTNNDYAFVTGTDSAGNVYYDRYKATVSGATVSWAKEYRLNNSSFTAEQWAAITSGITAAAVARIPAGTVAEIDDTGTNAQKVWSSNKSVQNNVYVSTAAQADAKTVPSYYAADGASVKVLFTNGHSGASFTINGKKVFVNRNGSLIEMGAHTINNVNWYLQAYTTLELVYIASLDSDAGGWLVLGNPVVLSSSSANESYTIYADGYIKQRIRYVNPSAGSDAYPWIVLPVPYTNADYFVISIANGVVSGSSTFASYAGWFNMTNATHSQAKTNEGFFLKAAGTGGALERLCYTEGY